MSDKNGSEGRIQWSRFFKKLSPYMIQKGLLYLKHYGPREFWIRLHERFEPEEIPYGPWYAAYVPDQTVLDKQRKKKFAYAPLISVVVPAYRTPELFLRQMIDSLEAQTYEDWELCIANGSPEDQSMRKVLEEYSSRDRRVRWQELTENKGIAENTNAAFAMAKGEFVGLLDHDDLLAPNALYEVLNALNQHEHGDAVYTDEDKVTAELDEHFQPHLKPDFNIDLLRSNNYITHFLAVKRSLLERVGGIRPDFDGAQDYDFILRCAEQARAIGHIPRILYHWRCHKESTAENPFSKQYAVDAGKRAIGEHLKRLGVDAVVTPTKDMGFYEVEYALTEKPLVSVIIPSKDEVETLQKCIAAIEKSSYGNYEVIVVENNSCEETFDYYKNIAPEENMVDGIRCMEGKLAGGQRICVAVYTEGFNYSRLNNFGVKFAEGSYYLLMNNDIEMIGNDWMKRMLENCLRKETGVVGAKLFYPDHTIQHAGIVVGIGGNARGIGDNMFVGLAGERSGYMHKASIQLDYSAVTAACLMVKREIYEQAGGFEEQLAVAFNDVDFCLKVRRLGKLVVYDPHVQAYHYESKSRGAEDSAEKTARFQREIEYMRNHWIGILKNGDPYYNPNFSSVYNNYSLKDNS